MLFKHYCREVAVCYMVNNSGTGLEKELLINVVFETPRSGNKIMNIISLKDLMQKIVKIVLKVDVLFSCM